MRRFHGDVHHMSQSGAAPCPSPEGTGEGSRGNGARGIETSTSHNQFNSLNLKQYYKEIIFMLFYRSNGFITLTSCITSVVIFENYYKKANFKLEQLFQCFPSSHLCVY